MRFWQLCGLALLAACGESEEARRVEHPVVVDAGGIVPVTTDLGFTVTVTRARAVVRDLRFTRGGETHAAAWPLRWLVGVAHAHPGHDAGGEVVGELPGRFVVDWTADGAPLGVATMLEGGYDGADFTFGRGSAQDGLAADDPLVGHTFDLAGRAEKEGHTFEFSVRLAIDEGTDLVGAPFAARVADDGAPYGLQLLLEEPREGQTVFDGIDFEALGGGEIPPDAADANRLRRSLRNHDYYAVKER